MSTRDLTDPDWLLNEEKGFVAFFRPRCGSTALTRWFFENLGYEFGGFSIAEFRNDWFRERRERLEAVLEERYSHLHRFVVVREPLDRAVSSYLHAVNNPQDYQWDVIRPHVAPSIGKHDLTFRQFVDFLAIDDLDRASLIWRRQSALSCWRRGGVNDIVELGALNDYLEDLNRRFGMTHRPGFNSVTVPPGERIVPDEHAGRFFGDVPFHELLRFKGTTSFEQFPDYRFFYDDELHAAIQALYADDIEIHGRANVTAAEPEVERTVLPRSVPTEEPIFTGRHFRVRLADGRPAFEGVTGETLIGTCTPRIATCRVYDLEGPVQDLGRVLLLRSVDGLAAGDWVEVRKDIAGGGARSNRIYRARIAEIDRERSAVTLATAIPMSDFSPETGLYAMTIEEEVPTADHRAEWSADGTAFVLTTATPFDACTVEVTFRCSPDSAKVSTECVTTYHQDVKVYSQGVSLTSAVPVDEIYRKNRQLERVEGGTGTSDYWLWKEGARFRGRSGAWAMPRAPEAAMVELRGARGRHRRMRMQVRVEEGSHFPTEGDHALGVAFRDGGKYASSSTRKALGLRASEPLTFTVGFDEPTLLAGMEIQWYDANTYASGFRLSGRVDGRWEVLLDLDDHSPDDRTSFLHLQQPTRVDALRLEATKTERIDRLAIRNVWFFEAESGGPELTIAFESHAARKYRRFLGAGEGGFYRYEERSASEFKAGDATRYAFDMFLSGRLPSAPRLKLSPGPFRATHVWTEHADNTHLRSHRAAYLGDERVERADEAVGGFVAHGHPVTKSVFFDNPMAHPNVGREDADALGEVVSLSRDTRFSRFIDELHERGHEICLHTAAPLGVPRSEEAHAIGEVTARYGSPTWIDHNMQRIRSCFSCDGLTAGSDGYRGDLWEEHGIRLFWHWASEDFEPRSEPMLDLLHELEGPSTITPLYWVHPTVTGPFVTWAASEGSLAAVSRDSIDSLVARWGVSIDHQYYAFVPAERFDPGYLVRDDDGRLRINPTFDSTLAYMSELRQSGDLHLATVGQMMTYWLALEEVSLDLESASTFSLSNGGSTVGGFAFVIAAETIRSDDLSFSTREIAPGEQFVWFDFPSGATVRFTVDG